MRVIFGAKLRDERSRFVGAMRCRGAHRSFMLRRFAQIVSRDHGRGEKRQAAENDDESADTLQHQVLPSRRLVVKEFQRGVRGRAGVNQYRRNIRSV